MWRIWKRTFEISHTALVYIIGVKRTDSRLPWSHWRSWRLQPTLIPPHSFRGQFYPFQWFLESIELWCELELQAMWLLKNWCMLLLSKSMSFGERLLIHEYFWTSKTLRNTKCRQRTKDDKCLNKVARAKRGLASPSPFGACHAVTV